MGKEATTRVFKFEGPYDAMVWHQSMGECNDNVDVVVDQFHEALFLKDGAMVDTLLPGRHSVCYEQKYSCFARILGKEKQKPFLGELYFTNKTVEMKLLWGTPQPMIVKDAEWDVPVRVRANGSLIIAIDNTREFVSKIVGGVEHFTTDHLKEFLQGEILKMIKDELSKAMVVNKISFYNIEPNLKLLSEFVQNDIKAVFVKYGIAIKSFAFEQVLVDKEDLQEFEQVQKQAKLLEMQGTSFKELREEQKAERKDTTEFALKLAEMEVQKEIGKSVQPTQVVMAPQSTQPFVIPGAGTTGLIKMCPKCKAQCAGDAKFCPTCGHKF